ncbi:hypothetical protein I7I53_09754 [Histoplasma capsulatum var. duboisii H88]|uniref:Uncharacterized protein n=1 Tax=Ajellomyces capsulatus (strain H88) TaxID=544711 RepID=A0A8A1LAD9_AJEC8|nr:hypothetical protein I7I53_09754 [Histoplasma capsulatum var. duboisii H88]
MGNPRSSTAHCIAAVRAGRVSGYNLGHQLWRLAMTWIPKP